MKWTPKFIGIALLTFLLLSYAYFVYTAEHLRYAIFDFPSTASWSQKRENIFRSFSHESYDTILLSRDRWQKFRLSGYIINPKNTGIGFHYQNPNNLRFIYFDHSQQKVFWAVIEDGKTTFIQEAPLAFTAVFNVELEITPHEGKLFINDQLVSSCKFANEQEGRFGLMLKKAETPRTIFSKMAVVGIMTDGRGIDTNKSSGRINFIFALLLLYSFLAAFIFYSAKIFVGSQEVFAKIFRRKIALNTVGAGIIHYLVAVALFWPFITRGEILISSGDNLGQIYPLFFYCKQIFLDLWNNQSLGLWNPYAHNGIPFYSNHWNMIFYPLNWPIFFMQDQYVLLALTGRMFLETFFIGLLAYALFVRELGSPRWALLCSIVYQMCSIVLFSFTVFPSISLYFAMTLYLYALWSMAKRSPGWNFILLSCAVFLILTSANTAFTFYAVLSLAIFTIYRFLSIEESVKMKKIQVALLAAAVLTGFLLSAIRIVPCLFGVMDSNRIVEDFYTLHDRWPMILRLFVPEIVGWFGQDSFNALTSPNLNFIFEQSDLPSNSQNTFLAYFGIVTALILLLNVFIRAEGKHRFWKVYAFTTIALGLMWQPLWGIFNILLFPFNHYSYYVIILPIGICMLLGWTGLLLEERKFNLSMILPKFIGALLFVQAFILVFLTYLFPQMAFLAKFIFMIAIVKIILYSIWRTSNKARAERLLTLTTMVVQAVLVAAFLIVITSLITNPIERKENVVPWVSIPILMIFVSMGISVWIKQMMPQAFKSFLKTFGIILLVGIPLSVICFIQSPMYSQWMSAESGIRIYIADILQGHVRFWFIALSFIGLCLMYEKERISRQTLVVILIVIIMLDLLAFNLRFDNVVAPNPYNRAFYSRDYRYDDLAPEMKNKVDLVNYRVNNLHAARLSANQNIMFHIPSYTGIMGHMPKRFSNFIQQFGYPKETVLIYPEEATHSDRFLDLSAVKYSFRNEKDVDVRPNALSRLSLFNKYHVVPENQMLEILKNESFVPQQELLVNEGLAVPSLETKRFEVAAIDKVDRDTVETRVNLSRPAVMLFAESFSKDWKAFVDGKRVPIVLANYNFMAIGVESGMHTVKFKFDPPLFRMAFVMSLLGLLVFVLTALGLTKY